MKKICILFSFSLAFGSIAFSKEKPASATDAVCPESPSLTADEQHGFFIFNPISVDNPVPDNSLFILPRGWQFTDQQMIYSQADGRIVAAVKKK